jgi:hypothetical protein
MPLAIDTAVIINNRQPMGEWEVERLTDRVVSHAHTPTFALRHTTLSLSLFMDTLDAHSDAPSFAFITLHRGLSQPQHTHANVERMDDFTPGHRREGWREQKTDRSKEILQSQRQAHQQQVGESVSAYVLEGRVCLVTLSVPASSRVHRCTIQPRRAQCTCSLAHRPRRSVSFCACNPERRGFICMKERDSKNERERERAEQRAESREQRAESREQRAERE